MREAERTGGTRQDYSSSVHQYPVGDVYEALDTSADGLNAVEARRRLASSGPNVVRRTRRRSMWVRFLANFTHLMAVLLWLGGAIAFIGDMPQLAFAIWLVNVINGVFSFWQEFRAEKASAALSRMLPHDARVVRDGREYTISAEALVPGDLILLEEGDRVSADCRVIDQSDLQVDQSTLTGESRPVRKSVGLISSHRRARSDISNLVFAGTTVASGTARAVVFATGMETEFGQIAALTQTVGEGLSPLQREIQHVAQVVTLIAVGVGVVFFILAVLFVGIDLAHGFIFALGMIVAFVPEGLLPTLTLALAIAVQRMATRHVLVKKLSAVETLGCTTVICSDKTGTITQNEMTVTDIWLGTGSFTVTGHGYSPDGRIFDQSRNIVRSIEGDLRQLILAGSLCNNAHLLPPDHEVGHWHIRGDPTEGALKVLAAKGGLESDIAPRQGPRLRDFRFDSHRKRMSTVYQENDSAVAYVKGAPRVVLGLCTSIRLNNLNAELTAVQRQHILRSIDYYSLKGLRVLAVAMRTFPEIPPDLAVETVESDLTFLGLVAMADPPRPQVAEAVRRCHAAGVRIIMITGDYGLTAETVGKITGITRTARPHIVSGDQLDAMSDDDLKKVLSEEVIFARATPEHKLRIVSELQNLGNVVAVTGDGVNDAPALKKADIGIAMGMAGTDVARETADIVLTDDNFASIVNAIEEGRAVYSNIRKFTTYIFTSNTAEAVPFIFFALTHGLVPLALNVMQILAVDLGAAILPGLSLGAEPPEPDIMKNPPRAQHEHVITPSLILRANILLGPIEGLAAMSAFYFQFWKHGFRGQWMHLPSSGSLYASATAMALAAIVVVQIGNLFTQRTERTSLARISPFSNHLLWMAAIAAFGVVVLVVYVPFLQRLTGTAPFALDNWLFLSMWLPVLPIVDELRKLLLRWRSSKLHAG